MWLFLWVVFVLTAAGFFLWSYHATYEQKRAWKSFANKYNLQYVGGKMMDSPSMTGDIKGHKINFYPQITDTPQGQKISQNVVEVFLNDIPDLLCVVATSGFTDFVSLLELPEPFSIDDDQWPKNLLARTFEDEAPELWFRENKLRIEAIHKLSKLPFDFTFLSDGEQAFVAIRTQNPLSSGDKINKVIGVLFDAVKKLEDKKETAVVKEDKDEPTESIV